ncbi:3-deoxy-manno-octulosonate cytidylyltransferase [Pelagibacterales bacterium SAG-MED39]|nr:3-deoxy-manno-octulosonate cytidylyltransferase [Pelagibacterales bacterium SAG-MED39]
MKTLIIIPSRLSATRLPGKPLLKINGLSMISHVFKKAEEANIGEVYVATEDQEIVDDVKQNGGQAILTEENHKTGTDRIHEALKKLGKLDIELVMNLQGDEPLIDVEDIKNLHNQMIITKSNIGTLASNIIDEKLYDKEDVVKVITKESLNVSQFPEALNFIRKTNISGPNIYHHVGIYCYRIETLKNFVSYNQSQNEIKNRLEQLRALDNDIKINVALANKSPIGVDTKEDLVAIKKIMEYKSE